MINLLPQSEKKIIQQNHVMRFAIASLVALIIPSVLGLGMLLPSYIFSVVKEKVVSKKGVLLEERKDIEHLVGLNSELKETQEKLVVLNVAEDEFVVSKDVVTAILEQRSSTITVTYMAFQKRDGDGFIEIRGRANAREDLLAFAKNMEDSELFSAVNLPVSNFVEKTNIIFRITMTLPVASS